jgi:ubiquinol-cytochrome c reductase cytochrome b subunit
MLGAIIVLFILPWLDTHKVRSMRFRPVARWFFLIFILFCFVLGWCGAGVPDDVAIPMGTKVVEGETVKSGITFYRLGQISTIYYFAYFLIILPVLGLVEKPIKRPDSITKAVLGDGKRGAALAPAE